MRLETPAEVRRGLRTDAHNQRLRALAVTLRAKTKQNLRLGSLVFVAPLFAQAARLAANFERQLLDIALAANLSLDDARDAAAAVRGRFGQLRDHALRVGELATPDQLLGAAEVKPLSPTLEVDCTLPPPETIRITVRTDGDDDEA